MGLLACLGNSLTVRAETSMQTYPVPHGAGPHDVAPAANGIVWYTAQAQGAQAYAVYVDDEDKVWLSDFDANAVLRFDPVTEKFTSFPETKSGARVRQLAGRTHEVWGAESGLDRLLVLRTK
jgi:streptogramin lyase